MARALKLRQSPTLALSLVLACLLIVIACPPSPVRAAPSQVWVDDDYTPSTPGWGTTHFTSVAAGVAAVGSGGTVTVAAGQYTGGIVIDKSLSLRGAGRAATTIRVSSGTGLSLTAPNIVVDSVGLVNVGSASTGVRITADMVTVQNSRLSGFQSEAVQGAASRQTFILSNDFWDGGGDGIYIQGTLAATISYNQFFRLQGTPITLDGCSNSLVLANEITQMTAPAQWGVALIGGASVNTISNNRILGNTLAGGVKASAPANSLRNNIISDNSGDGIRLEAGADSTLIDSNTISGNGRRGIVVGSTSLSSVRILNNKITGNGAALSDPGLLVAGARNCTIYGNLFVENGKPAVDNGPGNAWYDAANHRGNFWSDYGGRDDDADGIGDEPYIIQGTTGATDPYPVLLASLSADPLTLDADSGGYSLMTATLRDVQLRPISGQQVVFRTDIGHFGGGSREYTTTTSEGAASVRLYADGTPGAATVSVTDAARGISATREVFFSPCGYLTWADSSGNPTFSFASGEPAAPSVVFGEGLTPPYRMWYSTSQGIAYAESADGKAWTQKGTVSGLTRPRQAQVLYDPSGFGAGAKFRVWYRDTSLTNSHTAIRYAQSSDGIHWSSDQPIAQDSGNPMVTGTSGWNRGTLGPSAVLYNPSASNSGTDPRNYRFVMLYDATDGSTRSLGLAYSADGILWKGTGAVVLGPAAPGSWDSGQVGLASLVRGGDGIYRMWYSGGANAVTEGIGAAISDDLIHWTRIGGTAPLWGPGRRGAPGAWNEAANFAPVVLFDPGQFYDSASAAFLKMWRLGVSAQGVYAIGHAQLNPAHSILLASGDNQYAEVAQALPQPLAVLVRDACGKPLSGVPVQFYLESGPSGAAGYSFSEPLAYTDDQGRASTRFTFGLQVGFYTIVASLPGADGTPVRFSATATGTSPATVRLGAYPTAVEVGGETAKLVAVVSDANANPAPDGTVVTFETDEGSFSGSGTGTFIAGTVNGEAVAMLESSTRVATATVRARVIGDSDTTEIQFVPGPPAAIADRTTETVITVGGSSATLLVDVTDRFGNPVHNGTAVTFKTDLGSFGGSATHVTTTSGGRATALLRSGTAAGMATIEVRAGAYAYRTLHVTFAPGAAKTLVLSSEKDRVAVGGHSVEIVSDVRDRYGNPVADGTIVTFITDLGALDGGTIGLETTTGGIARAHLVSGAEVGTAHVRAEAGEGSDEIAILVYNSLVVQSVPWQNQVCPNNPLRFSLVIDNAGDINLTGVFVRDVLPQGAYFSLGGSSPGVQIFSDREVGWLVSTVPAHSEKTLYLEVTTSQGLAIGTVITNTVYVRANEVPEASAASGVVVRCASQTPSSPTPTVTRTPTPTPTRTRTPTVTPSATPTFTLLPSPTYTLVPSATPTPTVDPTPGGVASPTPSRAPSRYSIRLPMIAVED